MTHMDYYVAALARAQEAEETARVYRQLALAALEHLADAKRQHAKQTEQMVALREEIRRYTRYAVLST